jgi:hypothetical protein
MMNWKECRKSKSWPNSMYYPGICLEGLMRTTKNLSQDRRTSGRDLNSGPPEYEAAVLSTQPRCSVLFPYIFVSLLISLTFKEINFLCPF